MKELKLYQPDQILVEVCLCVARWLLDHMHEVCVCKLCNVYIHFVQDHVCVLPFSFDAILTWCCF